jgi:hypothetical protein
VPVKQYAYVWFEAGEGEDFDPDEVTRRLGVSPTEAHKKGDPRGDSGTWRRSAWDFGVAETDEVDWDALVAPLLAAFDGRERDVRQVCDELRIEAGIMIVTRMIAEKSYAGEDPDRDVWGVPTPASGLSIEHVAAMARFGFSFQADMYVWLPKAVEEAP